ncbi:MAG TPA: alpha/beta hydrolase [Solirubrobacteraceae bacterium]
MPRLSVPGSELHYERRGDGTPLLLIQGMGANSRHWGEPFLCELVRDFDLILYDHRGVGRSGPLPADASTADLAADALLLLDELEIARAHVFGISMGGMVAQELALSAPARVATLTLGGTTAGGTQSRPTSQEVVSALTAAVLSGDRERILRTGFEFVVSRAYAGSAANYSAFAAAAAKYPATVPVLMSQQKAVLEHDTYGRLRGLSVPTLVIHGSRDQMLAAVNADLIASLVPGARLELLEGVGHLFFWEQPERSAQLIREHAAAHQS